MCQAPNKKKQVVDSQELLKKHAVAYCQLRTIPLPVFNFVNAYIINPAAHLGIPTCKVPGTIGKEQIVRLFEPFFAGDW